MASVMIILAEVWKLKLRSFSHHLILGWSGLESWMRCKPAGFRHQNKSANRSWRLTMIFPVHQMLIGKYLLCVVVEIYCSSAVVTISFKTSLDSAAAVPSKV